MGTHHPIATPEKNGAIWLAGEASGDYLASLVMPEVISRMDGAPQYGVGGAFMRKVGFHAWHDIRELSVRGYVEVLSHLPRLMKLRSSLIQRFSDSLPQVFVGVDAPDFNLGIEAQLRRRGIPTVHFISPSIWAWRPERINNIRSSVDHMLLVFPFEKEIYKKAGIPATYVGHPLASVIPMQPDTLAARRKLGIENAETVITIMPGSRKAEIEGCGRIFFKAVDDLLHRIGDCPVLIPAANEQARESIIFEANQFPKIAANIQVEVGVAHRMIEAASVVLVASGTAALECALFKKPMVVGYKMPALTGMIMQKKGLSRCVSLPNILLKENVIPEFLQYFCESEPISYALEEMLNNTAKQAELKERFSELHESLIADTPTLAAEVISKMAQRKPL